MINPYIIIAALVAILSAGAGGFKLGADHEIAAQAREAEHVQKAIEAANAAAAAAIANIKVVNTTVQNEVQREIRTNTVYASCKHTSDSLRLINGSLGGTLTSGDSKLPEANTAR